MDTSITKNKEDYLNEIYRLQTAKNSAVKSADIALALNVSKPSVSQMLKKMSGEGLIAFSGKKGVTLTKEGVLKARRIIRKHQLLEVFFADLLKIKSYFHKEAHNMEHELSDDACDKLDSFLNKPSLCPDGNPIPKKNSKIMVLNNLPLNSPAKILFSRINDNASKERLNSLGIVPNVSVKIIRKLKSGPLLLDVKGTEIALGDDITSNIFVERE